jgi:hypothetical protein
MALQSCSYVCYGHLNVYVINGRGKDVWPVAIVSKMLIECSDQVCIGGGGDWLE